MTDGLQYETFRLFGVEASEYGLQALIEWALNNLDFVQQVGVDTRHQSVCAAVLPGTERRAELAAALERLGFRVGRSLTECDAARLI